MKITFRPEVKSTEGCDFCHFLSHPILKGLS